MKRVNIQRDVESREQIASAISRVKVIERINKTTPKEDGKTEEVQGCEDHPAPAVETGTPPKRGRKTGGNV